MKKKDMIGIIGMGLIILSSIVFLEEELSIYSLFKFVAYNFGIAYLTLKSQKEIERRYKK